MYNVVFKRVLSKYVSNHFSEIVGFLVECENETDTSVFLHLNYVQKCKYTPLKKYIDSVETPVFINVFACFELQKCRKCNYT